MSLVGMLFLTAIVPALILISGYIMRACPIKQPNAALGYRTRRSRASTEAWLFAQKYCGRLRLGLIIYPVSAGTAVVLKLISDSAAQAVFPCIMLAQVAAMLSSVLLTERALKQNFDAEGKPLAMK